MSEVPSSSRPGQIQSTSSEPLSATKKNFLDYSTKLSGKNEIFWNPKAIRKLMVTTTRKKDNIFFRIIKNIFDGVIKLLAGRSIKTDKKEQENKDIFSNTL